LSCESRLGTVANDIQHLNWVEPNGNCPTCCDAYGSFLANLLGSLTGRTAGAVTLEVVIRV
jgi:hypothetical protein